MSLLNRFYIRLIWRGEDGKKFFSDLYHIIAPDVQERHARIHLDLLIFFFFVPAEMTCLLFSSNARIFFFLVYFQSVMYSHHSSNWQNTIVLLIKTKKELIMHFPLFSLFMDCPLNLTKSKETRQCPGLKRDRT